MWAEWVTTGAEPADRAEYERSDLECSLGATRWALCPYFVYFCSMQKVWRLLRSKLAALFSMDLVVLTDQELICEGPRSEGRVMSGVLSLEGPVLHLRKCGKCFQYRALKGEYARHDTSLGPWTFTHQFLVHQSYQIHREQRGQFGAL